MDSSRSATLEFAEVVRPHLQQLYRLAFRLTGSREDAEDLVQEVMIKAHGRSDELTSIVALGPWLCRVLYNAFVDNARRYGRKRLRTVSLDAREASAGTVFEPASEAIGPEQAAMLEFDIRSLRVALGQLSLEHRAVLMMHDAEGYKLEEIQTITGTPIGTLKSRLHRARGRLREILAANGTF